MTKYFTNNFSVINLHKRPSIKSEIVTQLIYGDSFSEGSGLNTITNPPPPAWPTIIAKELNISTYSKNYNSSKAIFPDTHYGVFTNNKVKKEYKIKFKGLKESLPEYINWYNKK